jgi:hypothetical protein
VPRVVGSSRHDCERLLVRLGIKSELEHADRLASTRHGSENPESVRVLHDLDVLLRERTTMRSSGDILRWVVQINFEDPEAEIRIVERDGRGVMLLTDGIEEIELTSWRGGARGPQGGPVRFVDTLGALQRRGSRD